MDIDHIKRMYKEAYGYIDDAAFLLRNLNTKSDSAALLKILGFEILLKCSLIVSDQIPMKTHNYYKLWLCLPDNARKKIIQNAKSRMHDINDFSNIENLLNNYKFVFERARYYYEFYNDKTLEEQHKNGMVWAERGSPLEEAVVRFFEVFGQGRVSLKYGDQKINLHEYGLV
jgi:hypothetical protein